MDISHIAGAPEPASSILLYICVRLHRNPEGGYLVERQAANGLRLWAEQFDRVIVVCPLSDAPAPQGWVPVAQIGPNAARIELRPLPEAYAPHRFLRALPAARRRLRADIAEAQFLCFALGGLIGDWGSVAALEAKRMGRSFAVWTDRVECDVVRKEAASKPFAKRLYRCALAWAMSHYERYVIAKADLGLFHGRETYERYAPLIPGRAALAHDIHLSPQMRIPTGRQGGKQAEIRAGAPLQVVYLGRIAPMKGPEDWVEALRVAAEAGAVFEAEWYGDGPMRAQVEAAVAKSGIADRIRLHGFVDDRDALLEALRRAHVFVFCHKTMESPRCLIEALMSATPIVGYEGSYARDLISGHGGGALSPVNDTRALGAQLAALDADRPALADLCAAAALDGAHFSDEAVFAERAALIRAGAQPGGAARGAP
jgi:colanic acid/amylovoran biosynthesis glycosyltransferase